MQPLFFRPILKRIRWGGRRLGEALGKPIGPESDYAESWEVADHGHDQSVVTGGPLDGWTLSRLVRERGDELFGRHAGRGQFPLLVKFLDASDSLSVQVHPDDARARTYDPAENGKTEAWVVIDAAPGSVLHVGLKDGATHEELRRRLADGTVADVLHTIPVKAGDCVFIPAGTVHAIGAGVLLAEVQQSSDITFRLYDWGRLGTDGRPRELHIDQALDCTDFTRGPVHPVTPTPLDTAHAAEELVRCDYFVMRRHRIEPGPECRIPTDDRFHVLMALSGSGELWTADGEPQGLPLGQTVLVPAACDDVRLAARGEGLTVLEAFLP